MGLQINLRHAITLNLFPLPSFRIDMRTLGIWTFGHMLSDVLGAKLCVHFI